MLHIHLYDMVVPCMIQKVQCDLTTIFIFISFVNFGGHKNVKI